MEQPYASLDRQLRGGNLPVGAGEAHGLLCALLCTGRGDARERWFDELLSETDENDLLAMELRQSLAALYRETESDLEGEGLGFHMLLPDDKQLLQARARALTKWCQGYLYGVGLSGIPEHWFAATTQEALQDFSRIMQMDVAALGESEEGESAFAEVAEFVRVAAILVYHDLASVSEERQ